MKIYIFIVAVMFASVANAQIFKCVGPDGAIAFLRCLARLAVVSPNTWEKCSERLSLKVVLLSLSVICGLLRLCGATTLSREPERKSP